MIGDAQCGCRYRDHGRGNGSLTSGVWAGSKGLAHTLFMMQSFLMHWVSTYTP